MSEKVAQFLPFVSLFPIHNEKVVRPAGEVLLYLSVVTTVSLQELLFGYVGEGKTVEGKTLQDAPDLIQFIGGVTLRPQHISVASYSIFRVSRGKDELASRKHSIQLPEENYPRPILKIRSASPPLGSGLDPLS